MLLLAVICTMLASFVLYTYAFCHFSGAAHGAHIPLLLATERDVYAQLLDMQRCELYAADQRLA